ncbi:MAG: penicillin-binding protein activator [Sulfuricaulis sp.]
MKPIHWLTTPIIICAAILSGCETVRVAPTPAPVITAVAEKAERHGEYLLAAREYSHLATSAEPPQKQDFQLLAVSDFLKAGLLREAHTQIDLINVTGLDASYVARKYILQARLLTAEGAFEKSIRQLDAASELRNLSPSLFSEIDLARAQAELALNNPIGAVRNLINREQYIVDREVVIENQKQLWKILVSMPRSQLKTEFDIASDPVLSGWIELALIDVENSDQPLTLNAAIDHWRKTHPDHPAGESLLKSLVNQTPGISGHIDRIALILPLTSDYSVAAQAVRDGFMAMDAANTNPDKPKIKIYDTGPDPSKGPAIYAQAVNDGAQFIVGPLGREAAEAILHQGNIKVPTLMLNHTDEIPSATSKYLFEFGLPPEQEARQVADRAYLDGHRQAAVFYPKTPWGERVMTAWTSRWQSLGGIVVASQSYDEEDSDFSDPIKHLLNITQSDTRKNQIEQIIGQKVQFESRARQDIDFIFLVADAGHGRLIVPQLNFYHAERVPVYSTSHIFTGTGDAVQDTDLDGVEFDDMPWMLVGDGKIQELRQALEHNWPYAHTDVDRLFALGIDSYAILPNLNRISMDSGAHFSGVTSGLSLDRDGRIQRQLIWARFSHGLPQLVDTFLNQKGEFEVENDAVPTDKSQLSP